MVKFWRLALLLICALGSFTALADAQVLTVISHVASVYASPDDSSDVVLQVKKGQRFKSSLLQDGFYQLRTKSGKTVWISSDDVQVGGADGAANKVEKKAAADDSFERWTFDFGGSSNFAKGGSAYELHVGVNYYFLKWLVWRNSPFYRFQTNADAQYGLDSSIQGRYGFNGIEGIKPQLMLGAGYRIANAGESAPLVEAGVGVMRGKFGVNVSVKEIFHSAVNSSLSNETLFSLNFSGGSGF